MQANQKISKDKGVRQRNLSGAFFDLAFDLSLLSLR